MQHKFIGRRRELKMLGGLFNKRAASLVVIRGRRRIGKSRLAQECAQGKTHYFFSGLPPTDGVTSNDQKEEFAKTVIDEVKEKTRKLVLPRNISIRPVLIHVNGVDEKVEESRFFSSIIDFETLLQKS